MTSQFDIDEVCEFILEVKEIASKVESDNQRTRLQDQCDRMWSRMVNEEWPGMERWVG